MGAPAASGEGRLQAAAHSWGQEGPDCAPRTGSGAGWAEGPQPASTERCTYRTPERPDHAAQKPLQGLCAPQTLVCTSGRRYGRKVPPGQDRPWAPLVTPPGRGGPALGSVGGPWAWWVGGGQVGPWSGCTETWATLSYHGNPGDARPQRFCLWVTIAPPGCHTGALPWGTPKWSRDSRDRREGSSPRKCRPYPLHPPNGGQGRGNPGPATPDMGPWALLCDSASRLVKVTGCCL